MSLPYRMPAEWEPHAATWLSWPQNSETWPGRLEHIPAVFAEIVAALHEAERVRICVADAEGEASARQVLRARSCEANVSFFHIPTNDTWARDHAPIFVHDDDGEIIPLNWGFNAWGEKYPPWDLDDAVPSKVAAALGTIAISPGMILEGGSIEVNGAGALLTDRVLPAQPQSQSRSRPRGDRRALATVPRSAPLPVAPGRHRRRRHRRAHRRHHPIRWPGDDPHGDRGGSHRPELPNPARKPPNPLQLPECGG